MNNVGEKLKELREQNNLTRKEVADKLRSVGIDISDKTIYGYESGRNSANADMFLALCKIYGCKNIMSTFYESVDDVLFTNTEWKLIEKYRTLDPSGQEHVNAFLDWESARVRQLTELRSHPATVIEFPQGSTANTVARAIQYFYSVSAGTGQVIFDDVYSERISIPDSPEYRRVAYAVKVSGHSMEPLYHDGDMLLVEPTCSVDVGEIGIFNVGGQAYVKKLGETELISLNEGYDNIPLTEDARCMGRVVDKFALV